MTPILSNHSTAAPSLLDGKVAFVTGAGSGIGRSGAMAMARQGARVVISDIDANKAQQVVEDLNAEGLTAFSTGLDVINDDDMFAQINNVVETHGRIDILHSHAGYQIEGNLEQVPLDGMDMSWRLNVRSHFIAARATVGHMRNQGGGSIIITSSNSGVQFDREMIAYATTKHAVIAMT
ncbi:MAG: SDR family oxidoreductase, partial [Alphaproteobacteria bacterium]|nr:SDR family oxidoreductase [Alphaproteobacteria bacterium]